MSKFTVEFSEVSGPHWRPSDYSAAGFSIGLKIMRMVNGPEEDGLCCVVLIDGKPHKVVVRREKE